MSTPWSWNKFGINRTCSICHISQRTFWKWLGQIKEWLQLGTSWEFKGFLLWIQSSWGDHHQAVARTLTLIYSVFSPPVAFTGVAWVDLIRLNEDSNYQVKSHLTPGKAEMIWNLQTLLLWAWTPGLGSTFSLLQYLHFPEHLLLDFKTQTAMWKGYSVDWNVAEAATGGQVIAFWEIYIWTNKYFHSRCLCSVCFPQKDSGGTGKY